MDKQDETNWREVFIEGIDPVDSSPYVTNRVNSSRYTWLTLIPKNLFEQFQRTANIWFLIVSIFQLVPLDLNPASSWSTVLPLCILLSITLLKDAHNTYNHLKKDSISNNAVYRYWNGIEFGEIKCKNIIVGQFLKIREGEKVPADVIMVLTGSSENCIYVDNSQTTGESNLTQKKIPNELQMICNESEIEFSMKKLIGRVKFEQPNSNYNRFNGKMNIDKYPKTIDISSDNMLYRGSIFRGCEWIIALVLYTGLETKIYLNIQTPKKKISRMEKTVNIWVLYILIVLFVIVLFSILASMYMSDYNSKSFFENFIVYTVLYNNIIPISLFVTMDIVRALQVVWVHHCYKKEIVFNTSDINENMGQVEYVLADKTGTITENKLKLHSCMIDFYVYERDSPLEHLMTQNEENSLIEEKQAESGQSTYSTLQSAIRKSKDTVTTRNFINGMMICNSVFPINGKFRGTSPDEIALIEAAEEMGIKLISRTQNSCRIEWDGEVLVFDILAQQSFSKDNKISRIVIKDEKSRGLYYIKAGLDTIEDILKISSDDRILLGDTLNHMSKQGLRTMVFAFRELESDELADFELKLESARSFPINCEARVAELFPPLENDMIVLGATGIEEVVLQQTQDCITVLKDAGVKIWLLSGDSESNTLLTAYKSKLFSNDANVFRINKIKTQAKCIKMLKRALDHLIFHEDDESISRVIRYLTRKSTIVRTDDNFRDYNNISAEHNSQLNASEEALSNHPIFAKMTSHDNEIYEMLKRRFNPEDLNYSISIDSVSMRTALGYSETHKLLVCLLICAESVAFHSLLPHDKAEVTRLLKENLDFNPLTLAIGDGDGDIPMMQAADVAVNISRDDSQAKNYCEVTISKFSQLKRLLLDIGHWNYYRLSTTILLFLYKNFMITVVIFCYFCLCDFSATSIFVDSLLVGFNLFNTTLPLILLGVLDYHAYEIDIKIKKYSYGLSNFMFNSRKIIEYSLLAIVQGLMLILFQINFANLRIVSNFGYTETFEILGCSLYIILVIAVLSEIWLKTVRHSMAYAVSHLLSIVFLFIHIFTLSISRSLELFQVGAEILRSSYMLLVIGTLPFLVIVSNFLVFRISKAFLPKMKVLNRLENYSRNLNRIYKSKDSTKEKIEKDVYDFHKYSLKFCSEYIERVYQQIFISQNINILKLTIVILWFLLICWTILEILLLETTLVYIITRVLLCVGFTVIMAISATKHFIRHYIFYIMLVISLSLFLKFGTEIAFLRIGALSTGVIPSITYILFNVNWLKITLLNMLSQVLFIISLIYTYSNTTNLSGSDIMQILSFIILNLAIFLTSAIVGHNLERNNRLEYKLIKIKELGIEKTQRILSFILPSFVKKRVKNGVRYIAEDQGTVTVLFCDIVDFESIISDYTPQELTGFLDSVFQKFDSICSSNGVTKIETVGKTYMACAGLKDSEAEMDAELTAVSHAQRALSLAMNMIQEVSKFKLKNRKFLQVKIGLNSGPVMAGVVGYHKPQFSLVGDTVNTASRMCSTLELYNKIQMSKSTYDMLLDHKGLYFTSNVVEAKGKGKMHTYIVNEGSKSNAEEAWLDISHLSSIPPHISSVQTIDRGESVKRTRKSLLGSFGHDEYADIEKSEGVEKYKLFDMTVNESTKAKEYRKNTLNNNKDMMAIGLLVASVSYLALLALVIIQYVIGKVSIPLVINHLITVSLLWFTLIMYKKIYLTDFYPCFFFLCICSMAIQAILYILYTDFISDFPALEIMYVALILDHTSGFTPGKLIFYSLSILLSWVLLGALLTKDTGYIANGSLVLGFMIINIAAAFKREIQLRGYFNLKKVAEKEIERTENLLTQMMPPHVLENMKRGKSVTDRFSNVTLLYADIVGFTFWSSDKSPDQVVGMLSELFTRFDKICVNHKVYKVHTIGDCYVVIGLMDVHKRDPCLECLNVINMGLSMIKVIEEVNQLRGSQLNMRIGVHTGDVVGGVIGTNIVRYDIYGSDVITANKMESSGEAGKINVSEITKLVLEKKFSGCFNYTFNKIVKDTSTHRAIKSYFLSPKQF